MRDDPDGASAVWVHFLFRFAGSSIPTITNLESWVDYYGTILPLGFDATQIEFDLRAAGAEGIYVRLSTRIGSP